MLHVAAFFFFVWILSSFLCWAYPVRKDGCQCEHCKWYVNDPPECPWSSTKDRIGICDSIRFSFPIIRKVYPKLIADSLVSVQPMTEPGGLRFYRPRYCIDDSRQMYDRWKAQAESDLVQHASREMVKELDARILNLYGADPGTA